MLTRIKNMGTLRTPPAGPGRRRRRWLRVAAVGLISFGLVVAAAGPAAAFSVTPSASIVGSGCTSQSSQLQWRGGYPWSSGSSTVNTAPAGTVYVCWIKYRISDSDPNGDYYA